MSWVAMPVSPFAVGDFRIASNYGWTRKLISDCTPPFQIDVFTDTQADDGTDLGPNANPSRGEIRDAIHCLLPIVTLFTLHDTVTISGKH